MRARLTCFDSGVVLLLMGAAAQACDLCAIYAAGQARGEVGKGFFTGLAEQFTHFGTLQQEGQQVPNPAGQFLDSSITQLLLGYNFTERLGLQVNGPIIYRSFQRPEGFNLDRGTESGLGDLSVLANYQILRKEKVQSTLSWSVLGGVKFPTGSTSRLAEEMSEAPVEVGIASGIHGHDLTLGSGSYDGVIGTAVFARWQNFFVQAGLQYAIRSQGAYDYRFANDLTWSGGPGYFVLLRDNYSVALQAVVSGETKGEDEFRSARVNDTAVTDVYLGPQVLATWTDRLSAQIGLDMPVSRDNSGLQIVPDYRVRAAVTYHF